MPQEEAAAPVPADDHASAQGSDDEMPALHDDTDDEEEDAEDDDDVEVVPDLEVVLQNPNNLKKFNDTFHVAVNWSLPDTMPLAQAQSLFTQDAKESFFEWYYEHVYIPLAYPGHQL